VYKNAAAWENICSLSEMSADYFSRSVKRMDTNVRRGDIFYADLSPVVGSEQEAPDLC